MWKATVASKVGAGIGSSFLPESSKLQLFARYISVAAGVLLVGLGILIIFLKHWIVGPICIALGGVILVIEFASIIPMVIQLPFFATVFDFKIRGPVYAAFCIPPFFTVFTIAPALCCIAGGALYCVLGYIKNEKAELPEYYQQKDIEGQHEQQQQQPPPPQKKSTFW
ncbi:hypothetical protein DLAC_00071 [Tieghemostelium lacteum]|uniref:Transmembrane protein n=1 Tax=Tieghemostelium lacteum TaxID=361077 RepID=A0A152A8Q8_TIELA|nr:hypothetical protein DLAC_00071 [Tieghemostelium lacteum]|eukprot:KYR02623.1 hypothetical protein DLAC_00071 [Tieghemostelium lacteum]